MADLNCRACGGHGIMTVITAWNENKIWCPRCEAQRFDEAAVAYKESTGIDLRVIGLREAAIREQISTRKE